MNAQGSLAIIGASTTSTVIEGADGDNILTAHNLGEATIVLGWVTLSGGQTGLNAAGLRELYAYNLSVQGASQHGAELIGVNTAAILRSEFVGVEEGGDTEALVIVKGTGLVLFKSLIRQNRGPGIVGGFAGTDADECALSPIYPFSNFVFLEDIHVEDVHRRGIALNHAAFGLHRKIVEDVSHSASSGARGIHSVQTFGRIWGTGRVEDV